MSSMLEKLYGWLKSNVAGVAIVAATMALTVVVGCGGFSLERMIKVNVPTEIMKGLGLAPKIALVDTDRAFQAWMAAGEQFAENIRGGYEFLGAVESIFALALEAGGSMFPGIGGLAAVFLGGLLIKGPGTGKEKNKSYNKGRADIEATLLPLLTAAGIQVP